MPSSVPTMTARQVNSRIPVVCGSMNGSMSGAAGLAAAGGGVSGVDIVAGTGCG